MGIPALIERVLKTFFEACDFYHDASDQRDFEGKAIDRPVHRVCDMRVYLHEVPVTCPGVTLMA